MYSCNQTKVWDMLGSEWRVLQNWMRKIAMSTTKCWDIMSIYWQDFTMKFVFFFPNSNIKHLRSGNYNGIAFEHVWTLEKIDKGPVVSLAKARFCKRFSRGALGSPWPFLTPKMSWELMISSEIYGKSKDLRNCPDISRLTGSVFGIVQIFRKLFRNCLW